MIENYNGLLNSSTILNTDHWGATITCDVGNKFISNHARIIFEIIKSSETPQGNPKHFFIIAEFCATKITNSKNLIKTSDDIKNIAKRSQLGKVILRDQKPIDQFNIKKYSRKSQTWVATREKIEALIEEIHGENGKDFPFILAGRRSFLARNAELYKICDPILSAIDDIDQNLFLRLFDSAKNDCLPTGMSEEKFNLCINKAIESIRKISPELISNDVEYDYDYLVGLFDYETIFQLSIRQQNCFTWAKMKLESIGIEFTDLWFDKIISVTRFHLANQMNDNVEPSYIEDDQRVTIIKRKKIPLKHSVTYDVNRDRRTENYKKISKNLETAKKTQKKGNTISKIGFALTLLTTPAVVIGAVVCPPSMFVTTPTLLVSGIRMIFKGDDIASHALYNFHVLENELIKENLILESEKDKYIEERNQFVGEEKGREIFWNAPRHN